MLFLFVLRHVLSRRHSVELSEDGREVVGVLKSHHVCDLGYGVLLLAEKFCGTLQTDVLDEVGGGLVGEFLEFTVKMDSADAHFGSEDFYGEVVVEDVLLYNLHDALHESFVRSLEVCLRNPALGSLLAFIDVLQTLSRLDDVVNGGAEKGDVERLGEVRCGSYVETFHVRLCVGEGCDEYDRDVVDVHVSLHALCELYTAHLRHEDIGDDEVWRILEYLLQRFLSVATERAVVAVGEFLPYVVGNLLVVIDDEDVVVSLCLLLPPSGGSFW